ncbi:MAG: NADH-quinone oxidoreductase subunit K, partial [Halobacteriota archaeon]
MLEALASRFIYFVVALTMGIGLYMIIASPNLVMKVIGVNLMQTAVFLYFIALA